MSRNLNNFRAMILAAGLGTRLRPLTHKTPKPLLPVNGRPMIDFSLARVKKAGITNVIINLHYLGGQIKKYVGSGRRYGLKIRYLHEPKILGTGGGIKNAERFLNGGPFVVINSDTLIDIDLKKVICGKYMFCGVQILEPIIFKFLKKPSCLIESGYKKLLRARLPVYTFVHKGYWNDIGTLQRYKSGSGLTF
ncbi:MAG: nucleotidyltransferase family protein [Deltaproteobacteria bacterium]|nr:nucleotidyltransferase family protein [Deltaproteobacteria bacterium]